jgi:hypothetical protein
VRASRSGDSSLFPGWGFGLVICTSRQRTKENYLMTPMFLRACSVAAGLAVSMAAFAQTTAQQPAQPQPRTQTTTPAPQDPESAGQTGLASGTSSSSLTQRWLRPTHHRPLAARPVGQGRPRKTISSQERTRARRRSSSVNASKSPARSRRGGPQGRGGPAGRQLADRPRVSTCLLVRI